MSRPTNVRRVAVIINPVSGRRHRRAPSGSDRAAIAREVLAHLLPDAVGEAAVSIDVTHGAGHAAALARDAVAREADLVIAWGGDGTVNEAAGPLIGTRTVLGIVPSGSGDGLARGLSLPREPRHALRLAVVGPNGPMDTGRLGDRHFLNVAGIGFDASVGAAFNRDARRGLATYLRRALGGVWSYRPEQYRLTADDHTRAGRFFLVTFANGPEYGNGLVIAPRADPCDGRLDLVVVADGSALAQIWRARRLAFGRERLAAGVTRGLISAARIEGARLECHVDGETFETTGALDVVIRPGSIRVAGLVGAGARATSKFELRSSK